MDEILVFLFLLISGADDRNFMRLQRKRLRDYQNPFEVSENHFIKFFRLDQNAAIYLIDTLKPHRYELIKISQIDFHVQVLATLNFLSQGSYQTSIGLSSLFSLSQPTMSRIIFKISRLITKYVMPLHVQFPATIGQKKAISDSINREKKFHGVIGIIDGTQIEIIAPPKSDLDHPPFVYMNRKGRMSINLMIICDGEQKIIACDARYPGSVHDASIWRTSNVREHLKDQYEHGNDSFHLLGDSGYPLEPWLMVPFCPPRSISEEHFNKKFSTVRNIVERTIGLLKIRFRCLLNHRVLHYHPAKAAYIIYSAIVLHNICQSRRIAVPTDISIEQVLTEEIQNQNSNMVFENDFELLDAAKRRRNNFVRQLIH